MRTQDWTIDIHLDEDDDHTRARVVMHSREGLALHAEGSARRNPHDASVPEIGEELATARALRTLADELMDVAWRDIENMAHPVRA